MTLPSSQSTEPTGSGSAAGACNIQEIKFAGSKGYNDNNPSLSCPVELREGSTVTKIGSVTYVDSLTPTLDSVSPRFGPVTGGT